MPKSPGTAMTCEDLARRLLGHLPVRPSRIAAGELRNIPRYVLRALIGVAVVCGVLSLWGSLGDGKMPGTSPLSGLDPYRISSAHCIEDGTAAETRWNGLSPALSLLDRVNPAVASGYARSTTTVFSRSVTNAGKRLIRWLP